jgi:hypothetical protein
MYQLHHTGCRHSLVGNSQPHCNKLTCFHSLSVTLFSAILLGHNCYVWFYILLDVKMIQFIDMTDLFKISNLILG